MVMPFIVVTDHSVLRALRTKEELAGRLQRYAKKLSMFDLNIQYQPRKDNLSQTYCGGTCTTFRR